MNGPVITGPVALADAWPAVASTLEAMLRHRGVGPWLVDDLVQETALRAVARTEGFATVADLRRWACRVAWHLAIDDSRAARHRTSELNVEPRAATDVAHEVEHRFTLAAVARSIRLLSDADQAALLEPDPPAALGDRRTSVRLAVRRHRARTRLLALVDTVVAVVAATAHRVVTAGRRHPSALAAVDVAASVSIALFVSLAASPPPETVRSAATPVRVPAAPEHTGSPDRVTAAAVDGHRIRPALIANRTGVPAPARIAGVLGADVALPGPSGPGGTGVRPKREDDHLLCGDTIAFGMQCYDLPPLSRPRG